MGRMQSMAFAGVAVAVFAAGCDRPAKQPEVPAQPAPPIASPDTTGPASNRQLSPVSRSSPDSSRQSPIVNRPSPEPGSTRLGVYTAAQAAEGYDVYLGMCNSCHAGLGNHAGEVFRERWGDRSLADMFNYMSEFMPKSDPGSLSPEDNVRVMAYLLKVNGMPAGKTPLPTDYAALERLWFDTTTRIRHP